MTMQAPEGPLSGITVLDLTRVLSGPYCTMILADLGARVIKVEQPGSGDDSRQFVPFMGGDSAYFASVNRGKQSIALDLKAPADRVVFERLLARADVLVENFRPGVLDKLGYGWAVVSARHPRLVMASISGFGQSGPYRERGAYDLVVQAMGGLMSLTGYPGLPPIRPGTSLGDLAASLFAANGIQAALLQCARTGRGAQVDVAMLDCQVALLETAIARWCASGESPGPIGARHPGAAPFDVFQAADGCLVLTAGADALFQRLAKALDRAEWLDDPRFASRIARLTHQDALTDLINQRLGEATVAHWLQCLAAVGVPAGPVNNIEAMLGDAHLQARGVVKPVAGFPGLQAAVSPMRLSTQTSPDALPPAPGLDEHRAEILRWLGD